MISGERTGGFRWGSPVASARRRCAIRTESLLFAIILTACAGFSLSSPVCAQDILPAQTPGIQHPSAAQQTPATQQPTGTQEAPAAQQPVQLPADTKPLELNQEVERKLRGNDVQHYEVHLTAGEFFHVVTTQEGIHLLVALFRENGEKIIQAERPNGDFGPVPFSVVADASGAYILSVDAGDGNNPAGRYRIKITAERSPTPEDLKRLEAERIFLDGLTAPNTPEAAKNTIQKWEATLPTWRALHDNYEEAMTENALAGRYENSGDTAKALDYENRALKIWRTVGDRNAEAFSLNFIGYIYAGAGENQKAIEVYLQALNLQRATQDRRGQVVTFNSLGNLHYASGDKQKALEAYQQALALAHDLDDRPSEATSLICIGTIARDNGDKKLALDAFEQALQRWRDSDDKAYQAATLETISPLHSELGQRQEAIDDLLQAVPLFHDAGDAHGEAEALVRLGSLYDDFGNRQSALEAFNKSLPLWRQLGDHTNEGVALNDIGGIYADTGEGQKALDYYNQSLELQRTYDPLSGQMGIVLGNIGNELSALGEKQKALEYFNQALPILRKAQLREQEGDMLHNMASLYVSIGEMQAGFDYYGKAMALERETGNQRALAKTLSNLGYLAYHLGEKQKALDYFNQSLPIERATGDKDQEATTLNNIGFVYVHTNQADKGVDAYIEALQLLREVGNRAGESSTLNNIGICFEAGGEYEQAMSYYEKAVNLARDVGDRAEEATTLGNIGNTAYKLGEKDRALESLNQAMAIAMELRDPILQAGILDDLMQYWREQERPEVAIFFGKQEINRLQGIRENIRGLEKETQRSFLKSNEDVYRDVADLLISAGRLPEAEQVLGLLKNEEYFEFIRRDGKDASSLTSPVTLTKPEESANVRYGDLGASVTAIGTEWAELRAKPSRTADEDARLAALSEKLKKANEQWSQFLDGLYVELGKTKQAQEAVGSIQENTSGMQDVLRHLDAGTVALYTLVGEDKYRVIVVTASAMQAREFPIRAADLRKKVLAFRQSIDQPQSDPIAQAQELYKILVGPVEQDLEGAKAKTLMWSLDDVLRYLPVSALHDGKDYLVAKYRNEIFTPASLSHLTERPDVETWRGLAMGVSRAYGNFLALPSVSGELNLVVRDPHADNKDGVMPGEVILNAAFTEDAMKKALAVGYPLVHIASHFAFEPGNETDSFLLLGGKSAEGAHLTLAEIRKDPELTFTDTQLLTLSACDTAMGGDTGNGREVDGLGILAQQKGARAVVASLWEVSDASTGLLMQEFYRLWISNARMPKAEALREAQLALLRGEIKPSHVAAESNAKASDGTKPAAERGVQPQGVTAPASYAHPYYWAPFVLFGNWR
ncbi:MAG TPA: tetratricopeptide repeat protein [Candidatus Acidoferrales bacterium]